jgi:hypothetical protein
MKRLDELVSHEALELIELYEQVRHYEGGYLEEWKADLRKLEQALAELASFSDDIHYAFQVKNEARKAARGDA